MANCNSDRITVEGGRMGYPRGKSQERFEPSCALRVMKLRIETFGPSSPQGPRSYARLVLQGDDAESFAIYLTWKLDQSTFDAHAGRFKNWEAPGLVGTSFLTEGQARSRAIEWFEQTLPAASGWTLVEAGKVLATR